MTAIGAVEAPSTNTSMPPDQHGRMLGTRNPQAPAGRLRRCARVAPGEGGAVGSASVGEPTEEGQQAGKPLRPGGSTKDACVLHENGMTGRSCAA